MQVVMMRVLSKMRVIAVKMRLTLMRASMIQVARFSNLQMQKKWTWSLMAFSSMTIVVESQLLMHKVYRFHWKQCMYCSVCLPQAHSASTCTKLLKQHVCISVSRAAERMGGAQGKYKKRGPYIDCARGVWGHAPRKCWGFTCSEACSGGFWGSFLCMHTVHTYIPIWNLWGC